MKIVGFLGSPRKHGNTAILLNRIMEGAKKEGSDCILYHTNDLNIKGCQGCNACKRNLNGIHTVCTFDKDISCNRWFLVHNQE
ncbi:flavodoxin family protein [Desulfotomaculum sp. 1211_IL3151]|uniref:flavodoxin family protein n=1 Tax=Desulfotomaculum sp. 1211_IL3151 TaxID=3084055 RepID=UPI003FA5C771